MNILFFASTYPHPSYPFSAFVKVLCEEMVRQGHDITVVAPQSLSSILFKGAKKLPIDIDYTVQTERGQQRIRVLRPYSFSFGHGKLQRLSWWANRLSAEIIIKRKRINADVFYAHFWNNAYNALYMARRMNKPLFVATGEDRIVAGHVLSTEVIKLLQVYVRGVICVSTKNKYESIKAGLTTENKCIVLPNAINPSLFHVIDKAACRNLLGFPQDSYIVAFCGRFNKRKGVNRVSEAIKVLNDNDVKSIFIGSIAGNDVVSPDCDGILFKGPLSHNNISTYLNCADVFVLPSLAEGCSNSIIEAMACGLPVISSALPFNDDICTEENSILVNPMDICSISEAIRKLSNKDLRKKLSEGALKTAMNLTISERTNRILNFISDKTQTNENLV